MACQIHRQRSNLHHIKFMAELLILWQLGILVSITDKFYMVELVNLCYIYSVLMHYIQINITISQTSSLYPEPSWSSLEGLKILCHAYHPTHFLLLKGKKKIGEEKEVSLSKQIHTQGERKRQREWILILETVEWMIHTETT